MVKIRRCATDAAEYLHLKSSTAAAVARAISTAAAYSKRGATSRPAAESRHHYYYYRLPTVVGRSSRVVSPIPSVAGHRYCITFPRRIDGRRQTTNRTDRTTTIGRHIVCTAAHRCVLLIH